MKKVLSLVLAVMLAVGMSTAAFAAITMPATPAGISISDDVVIGEQNAIEFDYTIMSIDATAAAGDVLTSASSTLPGAGTNAILKIIKAATSSTMGTARVTFTPSATAAGPIASGADAITFTGTNDLVLTFTGNYVANGTTPVIPGAADKVPASWKITGFNENWKGTWAPKAKKIVDGADGIDQKDLLPIEASMFNWEYKKGGTTYKVTDVTAEGVAADAKLRSSQLSNVGVRRVYQKGTNGTIRDVTLMDSDSEVRVRTVKFYTKTGDTDVELKLGLTFKSKTSDELVYEYSFNMENREELIEEGQNECVSYGAVFQKADATVRDVTFEGDEDGIVFATKTVVKGQKYYFNVDSELSDDDAKIVADNPEVDSIYTVYSVNMANATVKFKNLDREFFVYDSEGKLLGTTKDSKLPLAKKYILTTAKVDFGGADEEPVEEPTVEEPADVDAPPMGGGEVPPSNNYNPNTGL